MSRMAILLSFVFVNCLFLPLGWAGGWVSTGGEFLKDSQNPWFLKNTSIVRYCIKVSATGFSANLERIEAEIPRALAYWRKQFELDTKLGIAKQEFQAVQGPCTGAEDIQFQFGYETLTEAQLKDFREHESDPQDFVAVTVRTEYDRRDLRGKGFLFFGSDRGPNPYNYGQGVATNLWQQEGVLYRVLVHELGHVFGVPHTPGVPMGQDYPELVLKNYQNVRNFPEVPPFFRAASSHRWCKDAAEDWPVPVPAGTKCLLVNFTEGFSDLTLVPEGKAGASQPLGPVKAQMVRTTLIDFPVKVIFTREQRVFDEVMPGEKSWNGPSRQSAAVYVNMPESLGGRSFLFDLTPGLFRINSAADNKIRLLWEKKAD